jgi:hypothetical protein
MARINPSGSVSQAFPALHLLWFCKVMDGCKGHALLIPLVTLVP